MLFLKFRIAPPAPKYGRGIFVHFFPKNPSGAPGADIKDIIMISFENCKINLHIGLKHDKLTKDNYT